MTAGLRVRITAGTTLVLALGLAAGGVVVAVAFGAARVDALDRRLREESSLLTGLLDTGQLPTPLPGAAGISAQLVDQSGAVLGATAGVSRLVPLLPEPPAPPRLLTTDASSLGGDRLRASVTAATSAGQPVTVVVVGPLTDVDQAVRALRRTVLLVVPVVVAAGAAASWWAVGAALGPVERLRAAADGVLDVRSPEPPELPVAGGDDELARLGRTLNAMLGRLHVADARQRAFVTDASHELRTPLASALTQLEVSLEAPPAEGDWPDLVRGVLVDVERLRALVDDLLLLARLDAGEPRGTAPVDLAAFADRTSGPVVVSADPAAITRAVDNLLANARRHADEVVRTSAGCEGADGVLVVEDDGDGVPVPDRERVFQRWTRLDDGRGRDAGGAGLGLAIARAAAQGSGGSLTVSDSELGGARFELRLPLLDPGGSVQPEQA